MIFLASPRTHLQTHSGEISMGAASGNRAGKPPEITLPVAAKPCSFHPSEIMDLEPLFIMADEKGPDYSSAKSATKMRQLENA